MIARLSGTVLEKHPMRVVIDVGGVGYDVHVPLSSFAAVGDPGATLTLRVHTHVREDALMLYGFASALEQLVFERLIAVSGIGPKLALSVLSGLAPEELVQAIASRQRGAAHVDSRHRQEDRRAHRARTEGQARRDDACRHRDGAGRAARRSGVGAVEPRATIGRWRRKRWIARCRTDRIAASSRRCARR